MKIVNCLYIFLSLLLVGSSTLVGELPEKHPLDESESRTMILDNGLRVIMVSDPKLDISSASMAVNVGSYVNPEGTQGLAHYLEHMLFLGTEKYPDEGEYKEYLDQNGGYSNAYTAGDHTNYHFQVFPGALEGALDRFAQFFIAPLFTQEFSEREINAVHSEFQKNLESDLWRGQRLFRMHTIEGHPENHFSSGNRETLLNVRRAELLDFYNEHYSANQMALSLVSSQPLEQMEDWVISYFSQIPNRNVETIRFPERYLELDQRMQLVIMKPVQDKRQLVLYFNTPSIREDWDAKSSQIVGSILGYEGEGSLLSSLKEKGLATSLGAGIWEGSIDYSTMSVSIELTPKGEADYTQVLEMVMGYIELMRQSPYPDYYYEEQATMARLAEVYSDKGEGAQRAVELANRALTLPLEAAEDAPTAYLRKDPDFYFEILDRLRPDNLLAILTTGTMETGSVEEIYGTEYTYLEIGDGLYDRLRNPTVAQSFAMPKPNPFVPDNVELLAERPVLLVDEPALSLYYAQDNEFQRPKVAMGFRVRLPENLYNERNSVALELYEAAAQEYVNEVAYDALMADLSYSIAATPESVSLSLFGYNESAGKLLPYLVDAITNFTLEEERFAAIKERMIRGWQNQRLSEAFMYIRYYTNLASLENYLLPEEKAKIADSINLKDIYKLRAQLFKRGKIEALIYGNIDASSAISMTRDLQAKLKIRALPEEDLYENRLVVFDEGNTMTYKHVLETNNSVFRKDYVVGLATPENRVTAAVLSNLINAPYYSEMRTRQQLGYVVWSFSFNREDLITVGFVIQSGEYDPVELVDRSDAFLESLPQMLREMPDEAFSTAKEAVRSEIEVKPKTIGEKGARFFNLAYEHGANWSRMQDSLDALDALTREDVIGMLESVTDPDSRSYQLVLLFARQHEEKADATEAVEDLREWKKGQEFRNPTEL